MMTPMTRPTNIPPKALLAIKHRMSRTERSRGSRKKKSPAPSPTSMPIAMNVPMIGDLRKTLSQKLSSSCGMVKSFSGGVTDQRQADADVLAGRLAANDELNVAID